MVAENQHGGALAAAAPLPPIPWLPLAAVISIISVFALNAGYTFPALALKLEARGYSATTIGLQAALQSLGTIAGAFAAPWLAQRHGQIPLLVAALMVEAVVISSFGLIEPIAVWYPLRFIQGFAASILFVIAETLLVTLAPAHARGRIVGIYTSINSGFFALGPALIPVIGFDGPLPYLVIGGLVLLLGLPAGVLRGHAEPMGHVPGRELIAVAAIIPLLLIAVFTFGFADGALLNLWGIYGIARGIDVATASILLALMSAGNMVLQMPIGWLADRYPRRNVLMVCSAGGLIGAVLLPWLDLSGPFAHGFVFVWGALSFGIYTVALAVVGDALSGARLVAANAAFGIVWGLGALIGAPSTGMLMDRIGAEGLAAMIGIAFLLQLIAVLVIEPVRGLPARE